MSSRFLDARFDGLEPYIPGEQPQDKSYVKLNTNESPFPPSPEVIRAVNDMETGKLNRYSDPTAAALVEAVAQYYTEYVKACGKNFDIKPENVIAGNGSDEILAFIFQAFCGKDKGMACPEIGYGFYPVFCKSLGIKFVPIELDEDFSIDVSKFAELEENITIANPNAQTGVYLSINDIKTLLCENCDRLVVIDEAYCDFGGESAVQLLGEYDNLIVVGTMSKSRQLAGGRVGYAIASKQIISDLNAMKYSFNPYNLNRLSIAAGVAAIKDKAYFDRTRRAIMDNRTTLVMALTMLDFKLTNSRANFVLASHEGISGKELYLALKEKGILVRFLSDEKLADWVRITIGSEDEIAELVQNIKIILKERNLVYESNFYNENDQRNGY